VLIEQRPFLPRAVEFSFHFDGACLFRRLKAKGKTAEFSDEVIGGLVFPYAAQTLDAETLATIGREFSLRRSRLVEAERNSGFAPPLRAIED